MPLKLRLQYYNNAMIHGMEIILKGWGKSGIAGLYDGSTALPPEDPFIECYLEQ